MLVFYSSIDSWIQYGKVLIHVLSLTGGIWSERGDDD